MAEKISKNQLGLTLGIFLAVLHALWAILVLAGVAKAYLNWILPLHFVTSMFSITTFNISNAVILTILAFIGGYVCGWVLAGIWNLFVKKTKVRRRR